MSALGTNYGEKFAKGTIEQYFSTAIAPEITNQDYEMVLSEGGADRANILTLDIGELTNYTGADLEVEDPTESEAQIVLNQKKAYYFRIKSWTRFTMYVDQPQSPLLTKAGNKLKKAVDTYVLGLHGDVKAGNRVGTNYTTGTVEVTVTTGAVAGSGTTFTSAMVGLGFKATGHTSWYRVKTYSSATSIVIEDDLDDVASAYTGGAISAGTTYVIEAATAVTVQASDVYDYVVDLAQKLDDQEIPDEDRSIIVSTKIGALLKKSSDLTPAVATAYEDVVKRGLLGYVGGFKVFQSVNVAGDNTTGFYCLGVHKSWCTLAVAFKETGLEEDLIGNFGKAYKGLTVYGAKVIDERRKAGAYLFCKV